MAEPTWLEVRAVVRCDPELVDKVRAWLDDSDLVEVNRIDVLELDDDLRRWDGGRPPGVVVDDRPARGAHPITRAEAESFEAAALSRIGMPEPCVPTLDLLERPTAHPVFDRLRRGLHVLEPLPELFGQE